LIRRSQGAQQIKVTDRPTRRAGQQPPSGGSGRVLFDGDENKKLAIASGVGNVS
jgi:hypothetical protein